MIRPGLRALHDIASAASTMTRAPLSAGPAITVAIPFDHFGAWAAQTSFLRSVAISMQQASSNRARIIVINLSGDAGMQALPGDVRELAVSVDLELWKHRDSRTALLTSLGVECVLSLFGPPPEVPEFGLVGWIADFQHYRMPQFFSAKESEKRDEIFRDIIVRCDRVLLSSRDAERDCLRFDPKSEGKTRVHPFPSGMIFQTLAKASPSTVLAKYHLPEKFALVANQFWAHKNHLTIIEAARLLAEQGLRVPIVLTGLPSDFRDPSNALFSKVLQNISIGGLRDSVIPLAQVPYADLVSLLRCAALIIQPSSFEGWSTTVQDAKALGRPVACSSIALHREQAPDAVGYFGAAQPDELAGLLQRVWPSLPAGPNFTLENEALEHERQFAQDYGAALWRTCAEAVAAARIRHASS